jgi:hypothetical protein
VLRRLFLWFYAATYDLFNGPAEQAGLREQRHDLLAQARAPRSRSAQAPG